MNGRQNYWHERIMRSKQKQMGFVLFSKPIYKPGDTVKLKAWITNKKEKPSTDKKSVWINYYDNGQNKSFELAKLSPASPGSYVYSFAIPDSFPNDTQYRLEFKGPKKYNLFSGNFKMEEYQLPDISKFNFNVLQSEILYKDSIEISLEANGTNGLPLLDAFVNITALAGDVHHFYGDSMFIADTLFQKKYALETDGKTRVTLPANIFPKADMEIKILATLINSSNEKKEETREIKLSFHKRKIKFTKQDNQLKISYTEDGVSIPHLANINISNDIMNMDTLVQLPAKINMHPLATDYDVQVYDAIGKKLFYENYSKNTVMQKPTHTIDCKGDSIGFTCSNPSGLAISYTLTKNKKIVWQKLQSDEQFSWYQKTDTKHIYHLHINYLLDGEPKTQELKLAVYYKNLEVQVTQKNVVQPGAKDTLHVSVLNYKKQPVSNVNLSASGQNAQLQNYFSFPSLPLMMNFKDHPRKTIYEKDKMDDCTLNSYAIAAHFPKINQKLGLDSMAFYQWMFATKPLLVQRSVISSLWPEVTVHAIRNGKPEPIYITYFNKEAYACEWQNARPAFSTEVYPGYLQIEIRTAKKTIRVDSVYMQPHYKHDVFINMDSIQNEKNAWVKDMPDTLNYFEKKDIERHFISLEGNKNEHNNTWLWQSNSYAYLKYSNTNFLAGPFNISDSINAYKEGSYHFNFPFESGYTYRLSQGLTRMEKKDFFPGKTKLENGSAIWKIGDTIPVLILPPPSTAKEIYYPSPNFSGNAFYTGANFGTLQLQIKTDSAINYLMLIPYDISKAFIVASGGKRIIHEINPGKYRLVLVFNRNDVFENSDIYIQKNGLSCYTISPKDFYNNNELIDSIIQLQTIANQKYYESIRPKPTVETLKKVEEKIVKLEYGKSSIHGKVYDKNGGPIPYASVLIKGSKSGTSVNNIGEFYLQNIPAGNYILIINTLGYLQKEITIKTIENETVEIKLSLQMNEKHLDDVVVIGYGNSLRKDLTGSVSIISVDNLLQGKVAGVSVSSLDGEPGSANSIRIRGAGSIAGNDKPLVVIDGVMMDEIPAGMDTSLLNIEVLKDGTATSIYGSRAANGVIIITTGRHQGPAIRTIFKDDAYWIPNTITDKNGNASIPIQYPENITNWQNIIYAAANGGRYGRNFGVTKAFKSMQGLLTVPPFLTVGDSVQIIGKAINFGANPQVLSSIFKQGENVLQSSTTLASNASNTQYLHIQAPAKPDTLKASFVTKNEKGFSDGEERIIPVFEKGTEETQGQFFVLDGDTSISFAPPLNNLPISWYAENKLIDVLEKELENLKNYPQACMEQTASKLWGLVMMRQIKQATHQSFLYEKLLNEMVNRLLKNQNFDGGWAWWPGGNSNLFITTKVLQGLQKIPTTETVHQAIRNGFIYLQNQLANKSFSVKLEALASMAEWQHVYPYQLALDSIHFDSLTIHQQWQWVRIKQKVGLNYSIELEKLLQKKQGSIFGNIFWGNETWQWQNNRNASTVLAFRVMQDDSTHRFLLPKLKQFFLEQKTSGYYRNTVEQAEISALLLTSALQQNAENSPSQIIFANQKVSEFPANGQLDFTNNITLQKKGTGLVYVGFMQKFQNTNPQKVDSLFNVSCQFIAKNGLPFSNKNFALALATDITLQVKVIVKKEAQFVQIEIPIPAGLMYASKQQESYIDHREYLKNKMMIFKEYLPIGEHEFSIPLQTRFAGRFSLNPAKVQLMYFPMLYGREGMKEIMVN